MGELSTCFTWLWNTRKVFRISHETQGKFLFVNWLAQGCVSWENTTILGISGTNLSSWIMKNSFLCCLQPFVRRRNAAKSNGARLEWFKFGARYYNTTILNTIFQFNRMHVAVTSCKLNLTFSSEFIRILTPWQKIREALLKEAPAIALFLNNTVCTTTFLLQQNCSYMRVHGVRWLYNIASHKKKGCSNTVILSAHQ